MTQLWKKTLSKLKRVPLRETNRYQIKASFKSLGRY